MSAFKYNSKFILDDELCVEDEAHECIDAYLWATDDLVDRVKNTAKKDFTADELESIDNINFYCYWNLKTGSVDLVSTFWYFRDYEEKHHAVQLYLSDSEAKELTSAINKYCMKRYGESCLSFLNEARTHEGLPAIEEIESSFLYNTALSEKTLRAIDKQASKLFGGSFSPDKKPTLDDRINRAITQTTSTQMSNEQTAFSTER